MMLLISEVSLLTLAFAFSNSRYLLVEVDQSKGEYQWKYYTAIFTKVPGGIGMDTYGLKVTHVAKGSQASKSGVRKGDEVHTINEKVYSEAYVKTHGGISLMITYPYEDGSKAYVDFRRKERKNNVCINRANCKGHLKRNPYASCDMSPWMSRMCPVFCNTCGLLKEKCVDSHPLCCTEYHHRKMSMKEIAAEPWKYWGNTCPPHLRPQCFSPFCENEQIDSEFLGMEEIFEHAVDSYCPKGYCSMVGTKVFSFDISRENCLKACIRSYECLGVYVGNGISLGYGACHFITETPKGHWETANIWTDYDMWKKTEKIDITLE